jgi:hypothetical protein
MSMTKHLNRKKMAAKEISAISMKIIGVIENGVATAPASAASAWRHQWRRKRESGGGNGDESGSGGIGNGRWRACSASLSGMKTAKNQRVITLGNKTAWRGEKQRKLAWRKHQRSSQAAASAAPAYGIAASKNHRHEKLAKYHGAWRMLVMTKTKIK